MVIKQQKDYLIVGQGLAGSALALALKELEASVLVVDDLDDFAASRVAAGLITTLAGKGMNPAWRQAEYLPIAFDYYKELERAHGVRLLHELPVSRLFDDQKQRAKFEKKKEAMNGWLGDNTPLPEGVLAEDGYFTMCNSGRLDTRAYLKLVRNILANDFLEGRVDLDDLDAGASDVRWKGRVFKKVIFCTGYQGLVEGMFNIPHRCSKGEMLTVKIDGLPQDRILNRNGWLVPVGGSLWRAGATYSWDELTTETTQDGHDNVSRRVASLVVHPFQVVDHYAGVRPIVQTSQPAIGLHDTTPTMGVFNGLGSKGVISSRAVAVHFAKVLEGLEDVDPELDYHRLLK